MLPCLLTIASSAPLELPIVNRHLMLFELSTCGTNTFQGSYRKFISIIVQLARPARSPLSSSSFEIAAMSPPPLCCRHGDRPRSARVQSIVGCIPALFCSRGCLCNHLDAFNNCVNSTPPLTTFTIETRLTNLSPNYESCLSFGSCMVIVLIVRHTHVS